MIDTVFHGSVSLASQIAATPSLPRMHYIFQHYLQPHPDRLLAPRNAPRFSPFRPYLRTRQSRRSAVKFHCRTMSIWSYPARLSMALVAPPHRQGARPLKSRSSVC